MTFVAMLVYITLSESGTFCAAALDKKKKNNAPRNQQNVSKTPLRNHFFSIYM